MQSCRIIQHVLIPAGVLMAEKPDPSSNDRVCKRSELPLYVKETPNSPNVYQNNQVSTLEPGVIENAVGDIRRGVFTVVNELKSVKGIGEDYVKSGVDQTSNLITFLQQEENTTPKYGAVAVGGVTGLILGLRGGFFRRTLYGSLGALGMAAICYPKEAAEYSEVGMEEGKRFATIAYNFVYGVKKGDPPLELPSLPKLPETMSEVWDIAKNLGKSTSSSVPDPNLNEPKVKNAKSRITESQESIDSQITPEESNELSTCHQNCSLEDCAEPAAPTSLELSRVKDFLQSISMNSFLSSPTPTKAGVKNSSPTE